jgi:hypothetical protein
MTSSKRIGLTLVFLVGLVSSVHAAPTPLDQFLVQRVPEELAAEGTILSRLGVRLEVELVGEHLLISLVDTATSRPVASTKLDDVPADREAAVASVTHVVATLAAQLDKSGNGAVKTMLDDEHKQRKEREEAEYHFKQEAISFGDLYIATTSSTGSTSVSRSLIPYHGGRQLDPEQFFRLVDKPDYADTFRRRTNIGVGSAIVGGLLVLGGGTYTLVKGLPPTSSTYCSPLDAGYMACQAAADAKDAQEHADARTAATIGLAVTGGGLVVMIVGLIVVGHRSPASESEVYDLADQYNAKLRRKYNMPGASLRPHFDHVALTPYTTGNTAGFSLSGRF